MKVQIKLYGTRAKPNNHAALNKTRAAAKKAEI